MADGSCLTLPIRRALRVTDLFCGAGGSSTGALRAIESIGRTAKLMVVNHWDMAIATHTLNHPTVTHHCADLEHIKPRDVVPDGNLDLLIASPTCTFHSRARGGRPVHDQQRMDPWHVVRWCTDLRVARVLVENVPEFVDWGPCSIQTGRPIPSRKGDYFRAWCEALRSIGYRLDWRVLCCADYGDATTRQRFFLIGRSDRKALRWPEPSHCRGGSNDLLEPRKPWRPAAEIIDWTIPGKSIFTRKRPLAPNTLRRILAGAERYGWPAPHKAALRALLAGKRPKLDLTAEAAAPFLINLRGTSFEHLRASAHDPADPLGTLTAGGTHVGIVMATGAGGVARPLGQPLPTLTAGGEGGARPHYIQPTIVSKHGGPYNTARGIEQPLFTVDTGGAGHIAQPLVTPYYRTGVAKPASDPLDTARTKGTFGLAQPVVFPITHHGDARVRSAADPLPTLTCAKRGELAMALPILLRAAHSDSDGRDPATRVLDPAQPIPAITGSNEFSIASPFLVPNFGERDGQEPRTHSIDEPVPTVAATGHIQLAEPAVEGYRIDILYRMLSWRELARAMSFDDEGQVYQFAGNATEITKQIGNAVPCRTAAALVRALIEESPR
jgi:DNA (cytosine-5)-methyltransferase 1